MSNTTRSRTSASDDATSVVTLRKALLPHAGRRISLAYFKPLRLSKRQFLFATNERFSRTSNFATPTKQSTSLFLFDTNEQSPVTSHPAQICNRDLLLAEPAFLIGTPSRLEIELTRSQQTRKHFLIGTIRPLYRSRRICPRSPVFGAPVSSRMFCAVRAARVASRGSRLTSCGSSIATHRSRITGAS